MTTRAPIAAGQISIRKPAVILSGPKITWICESSSGGRVKSWSDLEPRRRQCWTQAFGHVGRPLRSVGRRERLAGANLVLMWTPLGSVLAILFFRHTLVPRRGQSRPIRHRRCSRRRRPRISGPRHADFGPSDFLRAFPVAFSLSRLRVCASFSRPRPKFNVICIKFAPF